MSAKARKLNPIGRFADVRHAGKVLRVSFIDCEPKTFKPKRARVQSPGPHQGMVLMPYQYTILELQ